MNLAQRLRTREEIAGRRPLGTLDWGDEMGQRRVRDRAPHDRTAEDCNLNGTETHLRRTLEEHLRGFLMQEEHLQMLEHTRVPLRFF